MCPNAVICITLIITTNFIFGWSDHNLNIPPERPEATTGAVWCSGRVGRHQQNVALTEPWHNWSSRVTTDRGQLSPWFPSVCNKPWGLHGHRYCWLWSTQFTALKIQEELKRSRTLAGKKKMSSWFILSQNLWEDIPVITYRMITLQWTRKTYLLGN